MTMFLESVCGRRSPINGFVRADEHVLHQIQSLEDGRWQAGSDRHSHESSADWERISWLIDLAYCVMAKEVEIGAQ